MSERSPPSLATLVLLSALAILSLNMFSPSLNGIAEDFGADYGLVSLALGGYLGLTAVLQLILGPLSDRYGRRPILLGSLVIFVISSIGCATATTVEWFLVCRFFQGAIISGMALTRAVIRDTVPNDEAASKLGYLNMAVAVAPMIGPAVGGLLDDTLGWRANFVAYTVMGAAMLALSWRDLGETNPYKSNTFRSQLATYPELFASRRFWGYSICLGFSVSGFYTFTAGAPLVAERIFGMEPSTLGIFMGTVTLGFFCTSYVAGRVSGRYGLTTMMIAGRLLTLFGLSVGLVLLLAGWVTPAVFFCATFFIGLGNGLTLPSANVGAMSVRPQLAGSASGLSGALTVGIGAIVITLTGNVLTPQNGAWLLTSILLGTGVIGLISALYVRRVDAKYPLNADPKAQTK